MGQPASILLLDDGELDNVHRILCELGLDVVRLKGGEIGRSVEAPRKLLISAGRRTLDEMPAVIPVNGAPHPKWICVHNQDFLPMRERLAEMGVHYLVQNALDKASLSRFIGQILRTGVERRADRRLPLGGQIRFQTANEVDTAQLMELSRHGCTIAPPLMLSIGLPVAVVLPESLGGGEELEIQGTVTRLSQAEMQGGHEVIPTVVRFDDLTGDVLARLESISRGEAIGTRITPLGHAADGSDSASAVEGDAAGDRREDGRRLYDRPVQVLANGAPDKPVLGRDLSTRGVRLSGCHGVSEGSQVTLALYGASSREEPVVVEANVSRAGADGEVALSFAALSDSQQTQIERLLRAAPMLDALDQPDPQAGRTVVAEVRSAAA